MTNHQDLFAAIEAQAREIAALKEAAKALLASDAAEDFDEHCGCPSCIAWRNLAQAAGAEIGVSNA